MDIKQAQITDLKELKQTTKQLNRQSQYGQSLTLIEQYKQDNYSTSDLETQSKILLRHAKAAFKNSRFDILANQLLRVIDEQIQELEERDDDKQPQVLSRLLFIRQYIDHSLMYIDTVRNVKKIKELYNLHPNDFIVTKYFVKIHLLQPRNGITKDLRQEFLLFKQAEKVNDEKLVKVHSYSKLTLKIQMIQIKNFDQFFLPEERQNLMMRILDEAGNKQYLSSNAIVICADLNSKRGNHEKAMELIDLAHTTAKDILQDADIHKKYLNIRLMKSLILARNQQYSEARQLLEEAQRMVESLFGQQENLTSISFLYKKAYVLIYTEDHQQVEELLMDYKSRIDSFFSQVTNKKQFLYPIYVDAQLLTKYINIKRPDLVSQIKDNVVPLLQEMGLAGSYLRHAFNIMHLLSVKDPTLKLQIISEIEDLSNKICTELGYTDSLSLRLQFSKAFIAQKDGKIQEAIDICQKVIECSKQYYEGDSINSLIIQPCYLLISSYIHEGKIQEATEYSLQLEQILIEESPGELQVPLLNLYDNIFNLLLQQGSVEKALQYIEKGVILSSKYYGEQSEQYCNHLQDQALIFMQYRRFEQAKPLLEKLIDINKQILGTEQSDVFLGLYEQLAFAYVATQNLQEGINICQRMLTLLKGMHGENSDHLSILEVITRIALLQCDLRNYDEAFRHFNDADKRYKRISANNPEAMKVYESFKITMNQQIAERKKYEAQFKKPLLQGASPIKAALWVTAVAAVIGTAVVLIKKRNQ